MVHPTRKGPLLILGAALLWSTSGAAMKLCALNGWQISLGRSAVAALTLLLLVPESRVRPRGSVIAVAVSYALTVTLYSLANKRTTAANSIFLQDTAPLYVAWLSYVLLEERPGWADFASAPLFLVGLPLFFLDQLSGGQRVGNLLALGSGVAFASCIVGLRRLGASNTAPLFWGNVLAALLCVPGAVAGPSARALDVGLVVYLGVFQLGISYALFARGLRTTPAMEASLLALAEPVLNPVWTFLLAHERPGRWALIGGALILSGTALRVVGPWLGRSGAAEAGPALAPAGGSEPYQGPRSRRT